MVMCRFVFYSEEYVAKTKQYIKDFDKFGDKVPSTDGLARALGIGLKTLYDWEKDPDKLEFSLAMDILRKKQIGLIRLHNIEQN